MSQCWGNAEVADNLLRYLMQRDHTDSQFRNLSENLETQEVRRLQV